jgi:transposase-like protein
MEPGAVASEVARAARIHSSQLFRWRRQLCPRAQIPAVFNPVTVIAEAASSPLPERTGSSLAEAPGVIEIEFAAGGRMRISGSVAASTVSALLKTPVQGKRREADAAQVAMADRIVYPAPCPCCGRDGLAQDRRGCARDAGAFAGSDESGRRAAALYNLIATAKLNNVDPQAWLADVLARLLDYPAKRIGGDLLPWNRRAERRANAARSWRQNQGGGVLDSAASYSSSSSAH